MCGLQLKIKLRKTANKAKQKIKTIRILEAILSTYKFHQLTCII